MKLFVHLAHPTHGNALGQDGIDAADPSRRRSASSGGKTHHLVSGVNAGIRSSGTDYRDRMICKLRKRRLKRRLNARVIWLHLPAIEGGTPILNPERQRFRVALDQGHQRAPADLPFTSSRRRCAAAR